MIVGLLGIIFLLIGCLPTGVNKVVLAGKEHNILVMEGEWILNSIYEFFLFHPDSLSNMAVIWEAQSF